MDAVDTRVSHSRIYLCVSTIVSTELIFVFLPLHPLEPPLAMNGSDDNKIALRTGHAVCAVECVVNCDYCCYRTRSLAQKHCLAKRERCYATVNDTIISHGPQSQGIISRDRKEKMKMLSYRPPCISYRESRIRDMSSACSVHAVDRSEVCLMLNDYQLLCGLLPTLISVSIHQLHCSYVDSEDHTETLNLRSRVQHATTIFDMHTTCPFCLLINVISHAQCSLTRQR